MIKGRHVAIANEKKNVKWELRSNEQHREKNGAKSMDKTRTWNEDILNDSHVLFSYRCHSKKSPVAHNKQTHFSLFFFSLVVTFRRYTIFSRTTPKQTRKKWREKKTTTKRQTRNPEVLESSVRSAQAQVFERARARKKDKSWASRSANVLSSICFIWHCFQWFIPSTKS